MFEKFAKRFIRNNLTPVLDTVVKWVIDEKKKIELNPDEKTVVGIITVNNNKVKIHECTAIQVGSEIQTVRTLKTWKLSELANLLDKNLDTLDFSEIFA
jgi:co-chaperonin GroES (HSP10)